jgi:hypothetical protein
MTQNVTNQPSLTTNGQLLIGHTSNLPSAATLTAGAGVSITNGAGSITISASGAGFTWNTVSGSTQTIAAANGYIANDSGAQVVFTLPASGTVGDTFQILGMSADGWSIHQNASQYIQFGALVTTTGTGGSLTSSNQYDSVTITCVVTNNGWQVTTAVGNLTIV